MKFSNKVSIGLIVVLTLTFQLVNIVEADDTYWAGTTADWFSPNWMYVIPSSGDDTYIDNGGTVEITSGTATAEHLYIGYTDGKSGNIISWLTSHILL